ASPSVIVLQFAYQRDLSGALIRFYQRGWPTHVDAVMPDGRLLGARLGRCGALRPGVQIRKPGYAPFVRTERVVLDVSALAEAAFHAFLEGQLGKPYDWRAILAFAVHRDWRERDAWYCSELIAAALEHARFFPRPLPSPVNLLTPRDLLLLVSPWAQ
ncbi:MAG: hypothetical protein ACREFC_04605, partial [Stellaceae bacterium]